MKRNVRSKQQVEVAIDEEVEVGGEKYRITNDNPVEVEGRGEFQPGGTKLTVLRTLYGSPCVIEFKRVRTGYVGIAVNRPMVPVRKLAVSRAKEPQPTPPKPLRNRRPNRRREAATSNT